MTAARPATLAGASKLQRRPAIWAQLTPPRNVRQGPEVAAGRGGSWRGRSAGGPGPAKPVRLESLGQALESRRTKAGYPSPTRPPNAPARPSPVRADRPGAAVRSRPGPIRRARGPFRLMHQCIMLRPPEPGQPVPLFLVRSIDRPDRASRALSCPYPYPYPYQNGVGTVCCLIML